MPADQFPTANAWSLYAHMACNQGTYGASFLKAMTVDSFESFGRMWNHTHPELIGDAQRIVRIKKRNVTGWSFFLDGVTPEWEHPTNRRGKTYSCRDAFTPAKLTEVWKQLTMACVLAQHPPELLGIQITRKYTVGGGMHTKVDVWAKHSSHALKAWLSATTGVAFGEALRRI